MDKDAAAVALGRKGGLAAAGAGARAGWARMTPGQRTAKLAKMRKARKAKK